MTYRNIHLHLFVDPVPTSNEAVDRACALARRFEARLDVSSPRLKIKTHANLLGGSMARGMAHEIEQTATRNGEALDAYVATQAAAAGIVAHVKHTVEKWPGSPADASWYGRTSDLCVLGLSRQYVEQRGAVEEWIFAAGRPCLVVPDGADDDMSFDRVLVSWDGSRSAARAVCDALPILQRAKQVRIVTLRGEKELPEGDIGAPLVEFLAQHGVAGTAEVVPTGSGTVGKALLAAAADAKANLIVMGAFGHSRLREFVLGGATKELLDKSKTPLFMSH